MGYATAGSPLVERIARAIAREYGNDPDLPVALGRPLRVGPFLDIGVPYEAASIAPMWALYERVAITAAGVIQDRIDEALRTNP